MNLPPTPTGLLPSTSDLDPRAIRRPFAWVRQQLGNAAAALVGGFLVLALLPGGVPSLDPRDASAPVSSVVVGPDVAPTASGTGVLPDESSVACRAEATADGPRLPC